jgi:hypothetical protein
VNAVELEPNPGINTQGFNSTALKIKKEMWLFWLFIYGPPNCVLAEETALPKLVFEAAWLQELVFDVPSIQNDF